MAVLHIDDQLRPADLLPDLQVFWDVSGQKIRLLEASYDASAGAPVLTGATPSSPSQTQLSAINGTISQTGLEIRLYKSADCSGAVAATLTNSPSPFSISTTAVGASILPPTTT